MRSPTTCSSDEPDPWAHSPSTSRPGPQPVLAVCDAPKARRPGERRGAEWIGRFKANGSFRRSLPPKPPFRFRPTPVIGHGPTNSLLTSEAVEAVAPARPLTRAERIQSPHVL